jgi:hypothetical protein
MPESRKNPKPEKCLKMRQNPANPLHPRRWENAIIFTRETGALGDCVSTDSTTKRKYTPKWQARKPYKAMESALSSVVPYCTMVSGQAGLNIGGAKDEFLP